MNLEYIKENLTALNEIITLNDIYVNIYNEVINCINNGNKLIFIGNGGSATDASHIVGEFVNRFKLERKELPAISFSDNISLLTAISNDFSFDDIFIKQLSALGNSGDIVIGLSTKGESTNILKTLDYAKENKIKTILVTGKDIIKDYDYLVNIPSNDTSIIQNMYMIFFHMLCLDIDNYYFEHRN